MISMVAYPYHAPPTTQGKVSGAARLCQSVPVFIGKIVPKTPTSNSCRSGTGLGVKPRRPGFESHRDSFFFLFFR